MTEALQMWPVKLSNASQGRLIHGKNPLELQVQGSWLTGHEVFWWTRTQLSILQITVGSYAVGHRDTTASDHTSSHFSKHDKNLSEP